MYAAAGFFFASKLRVYWPLLPTLAGMALVIASACVFNNCLDRDIDAKMSRTKKRALVSGAVSLPAALIYAVFLGAAGFAVLGFFTNSLVVDSIVIAYVFYVLIYDYAKRHSVHGTLVGAIPGAMPPVAGYLAVTNHLDPAAGLLFLTLVFWQMPHFYAIAMYRYKDYKAAGLPVITVRYGMRAAKLMSLIYIFLFTLTAAWLSVAGYAGYIFRVFIILIGIYWLAAGLKSYGKLADEIWGRKMFVASLKVTLVLSLAIATGSFLP